VTRAFTTGAPAALDRPASPTVFLAFAAGEPDERIPLPCTYEESYEVTVIMVSAPSARSIHARMRYADETGFSHAITHVVPEGATGATLFAWAQDRGLPCVEVVVEGADGSRTDPTVVCQAVGCVEGEEWSAAVGRSVEWWREEYGPGSCSAVESAASARSCACVAMAQARSAALSVIAGLMVVLVFLRRPKRRSGSAVSVLSGLLIGCASSLEAEETALEAARAPIAEAIELEAGVPPLDLQLSLLAAESRRDAEHGPRCRVLVGGRFVLPDGDFVGIGDLHWDEFLGAYRLLGVSDSHWRPWQSWGTPLAQDAILERFFAPFWAFGHGRDPDGATVHPEAWRSLFRVEPLVSYPEGMAPTDLRCE
jgi:hypothetical protein